ncbi:M20/M25/M40 family metallo-hydrolase [Aquimarina sp. 2201CG5-10]|uniref:M20/M25/M40 family metallo-hydrolase n=1 Tax=Aquimarina callyspongiae TaxID=3098150 RepID=UPI002AB5CDAA|nr:M20/M25/M40 family metallo-hydrolase [Aquimarina sp. 2201CG5-10]MDY8134484.1 M20/M25/M40 family metallo-hydrolase [Aquimarina sp. 2201CG5-10]
MKKLSLIISIACLCLFLTAGYAQKKSKMFFATMETADALGLKKDHPKDIRIMASQNGYSAVMLSPHAAEELHHKILTHGPGFIYESSEKNALNAIKNVNKLSLAKQRAAGFSITQDQLVRQSLDLVNNVNIANQIQELENYGTRYHTTNSARQAVLDLKTRWENMAGSRSDISVRIVNHTSTNMPSVVMTIRGTDEPDEFVILGGHIDSTAGGNNNNAPGADDNASGIATITEAARVLFSMNFKPKRTIELMAFAAEEVGLRGSKEIAEDYKNRNVNVVSYMQLDMTNYKGSTNDVYISTDSYNDDTLNDFMIELLNHYNASGTHRITYGTSQCNYGCSDHYSWAQQGYKVTFPFEARFGEHNPNIHTTRDTFDRSPTPNATHAAKFAKLALEYLIEISNGVSGGGGGEPCANTVNTFPYNQGFEGSIGNWAQSSNDDLNWTVDANGTPSNGTGPASAAEGSSYIYVEASGSGTGFPSKNAILNSPCFDLNGVSSSSLSFKYHMQGSAIGTLSVEASDDGGATWSNIYEKTGEQGSGWNTADINLASYTGGVVQFRLSVVTGSSWQGDIAIDDLSVGGSGDPDPDVCVALDFNDYTVTSFSNQDNAGNFSIVGGGSGLSMQNNTWKYIAFNYTVTANTVLEFDFSSTSQGEIHGIGFENDNTLTSNRYFKVHGTQNYGVTNYDNYSSGTISYTIPVGDFYTGAMDRLVFVNDNDAGSGNNSTFSNVKVYEGSCSRSTESHVAFGTNTPILGNEDESVLSAIIITPNPTKDSFVIHVKDSKIKNVKATIYTILGEKASQMILKPGINTVSAKNLSLGSGIYLIKIESEGERTVVQKVIIQ